MMEEHPVARHIWSQEEFSMADTWAEHLQALGLTELEALAQSVSYRIRAANSSSFDLEYTGGLARYHRPGKRLGTFTSVEDASAYLTQVKREMEEHAEILAKLQRHRGYRGWRIRPYPPRTTVFLAETSTYIGRGNTKGWRALWDEKDSYRTFPTPEQAYDALLAMQKGLDDLERQFEPE
jgi:hypothetical protein